MKRNLATAYGILHSVMEKESVSNPTGFNFDYLEKNEEDRYHLNLLLDGGYLRKIHLPEVDTMIGLAMTWKEHRFLESYDLAAHFVNSGDPLVQFIAKFVMVEL